MHKSLSATGIEIRGARNRNEIKMAYELASSIFGSNYKESRRRKNHYLRYDKIKDPGEVIIAMDNGRIIGTLRVVERRNMFLGSLLKTAGITNVCVDPDYQGKGVGRGLVERSIELMCERKYPISLVVARRAVDGFYAKYGFVGTGIFCDLSISNLAAVKKDLIEGNNYHRCFDKRFVKEYERMYNSTYAKIPLSFYRSGDWWRRFDQKNKHRIKKKDFVNIVDAGKLIGYFIVQNKKIVEAASYLGSIARFSKALIGCFVQAGIFDPDITISPVHPCHKYIKDNFSHTFSARRVFNGGHMVRIVISSKVEDAVLKFIRNSCHEFTVNQRSFATKRIKALFRSSKKMVNHDLLSKIVILLSTEASNPVLEKVKNNMLHTWGALDEF